LEEVFALDCGWVLEAVQDGWVPSSADRLNEGDWRQRAVACELRLWAAGFRDEMGIAPEWFMTGVVDLLGSLEGWRLRRILHLLRDAIRDGPLLECFGMHGGQDALLALVGEGRLVAESLGLLSG
jgi:hypothetical protein